jgi:Skp family chaperone for outer membrane proteins
MRTKTIVLSCLTGLLVLFFAYEHGQAESKADTAASKIAVVSIQKIFQECKKHTKYMEAAVAEQQQALGQLQKLAAEIEAEEAGLKALKPDSSDYMARFQEILKKQANLQAQQQFYKQSIELKDQRWTEQLYKDILRLIGQVAQQKDLCLVLDNDKVQLPTASARDLFMAIRSHKVLYSGGCLDITDEVMARLDAGK